MNGNKVSRLKFQSGNWSTFTKIGIPMILWMVDPYDSSLCKCCMSCNISSLKSNFEMSARFVVMFLPSKVSGYCQHVFELEVAISISSQNSRDR